MNGEVDFGEVFGCVDRLRDLLGRPGDTGQFVIKRLLAVERWALAQQPVKAGDRIEVWGVADRISGKGHGWWPYRDDLRDGMPGLAVEVSFKASHDYWGADVRLDSHPGHIFYISVDRLRTVGEMR